MRQISPAYLVSFLTPNNHGKTRHIWKTTIYYQTQQRGTNDSEYEIYLACADDGKGSDITTGKPLKTYDEWLAS